LSSKFTVVIVFLLLLASTTIPLFYTYTSTLLENLDIRVAGKVLAYRLYRSLYAIIAGVVLAASGCMLQASLRNPLVDHYVLGIGTGSLFAVYTALLLLDHVSLWALSLSATIGGLVALALTVLVAESVSGSDVAYVLSGIGVTSLFSGLSVLLLHYVVRKYAYASLMLTGTFIHSRPDNLQYAVTALLLVLVGYFTLSKRLNALMLGDDYAAQLGVDPNLTRLLTSLVAGVSASIIVSQFGVIGFLGLVTPHIARFTLRTSDNRLVVPVAMATGSLLLYMTDTVSRALPGGVGEIPAGALISAIGAPFFLILLTRRFRGVLK
jgi:iron complex transport system permease protein